MKKFITLISILCLYIMTGCEQSGDVPEVSLSVWGSENEQELLGQMAEEFASEYADEARISITVCEESESTCRDTVLFSPEHAADVYAFADDQLTSLVQAGALLSAEDSADIIYDAGGGEDSVAVAAASCDGTLYAYPMTASNGYFLYYDRGFFDESDVRSLDRMLDIAARNDRKVCMDLTSGWYLYSFFRGGGMDVCMDESGKNICDFNSVTTPEKGVDVAAAIADIAAHPGFLQGDNDVLVHGVETRQVIAAVSGTWNEPLFMDYFGDGYDAAMLPEFTVSGDAVQMHSVMGYKLVGVNAHSKEPLWAKRFALWITNEDNQIRRFQARGEGPADVHAAAREEVLSSRAIAALSAQSRYGHLQRVADSYWDPTYRLGVTLTSGLTDRSSLQKLLDDTVKEIEN